MSEYPGYKNRATFVASVCLSESIKTLRDENPAGELVGRWIVKNKKLTSFEKKTKPIDYKKKIF